MNYKETMNLLSPSGYAMPFELSEKAPLEISLNYGTQVNPKTGKKFHHNGVDFKVSPATLLKALATGVITGISQDNDHGTVIQVTYANQDPRATCRYDVLYGHVTQVGCRFGQQVNAGDNIAKCNDLLHIGVKYNGATINPLDFLVMVRDNLLMESQKQIDGNNPEMASMDFGVRTPYDAYQSEIDMLYSRYFLRYLVDASVGRYRVPDVTSNALTTLIEDGLRQHFIFEQIPSSFNPAGLGRSSVDWQSRMSTLLFEDFQLYLALKHGVFLSHLSELEKKKLLTGL